MLFGEEPDQETQSVMDVDFILHAEHSSNASSFGARVVASTFSDLHSAVVAGIGVLKGPWHGGAAEGVMQMATEIGQPENAEEYARKLLDSGGRIMGFGHRVYKAEDPRGPSSSGSAPGSWVKRRASPTGSRYSDTWKRRLWCPTGKRVSTLT